jgi:hypothetical protein
MKQFALVSVLAVGCAAFGTLAIVADVQAQEAPKPEEKKPDAPKPEDKKPDAPKADEKKPDAPKADEKKPAAEKDYKDDFKDLESLMKAMRTQKLKSGRSVKNKNADEVKDQADRVRYAASKMTEFDKKDRAKKEDYKKWAADLEKQAREWRELASAKTPDWDKISTKRDEVLKTCDNCHDKYEEKKK